MQVFDHVSKPIMLVIFLCLSDRELLMSLRNLVLHFYQPSTNCLSPSVQRMCELADSTATQITWSNRLALSWTSSAATLPALSIFLAPKLPLKHSCSLEASVKLGMMFLKHCSIPRYTGAAFSSWKGSTEPERDVLIEILITIES